MLLVHALCFVLCLPFHSSGAFTELQLHPHPGVESLERGSRGPALNPTSFIYYRRLCYLRKRKVGDKYSRAKLLSSTKHNWVWQLVLMGLESPRKYTAGHAWRGLAYGRKSTLNGIMGWGPEQEVNWILSFISLYFLLTDVIWLANGNFNWWEYRRAPFSPTHIGPIDYWELAKGPQEDNWKKSPYSLYPFLSFTDL